MKIDDFQNNHFINFFENNINNLDVKITKGKWKSYGLFSKAYYITQIEVSRC